MTKATGAEIWDFYCNGWPENHYYEENEILICDDEKDPNKCLLEFDKEYDLDKFGFIGDKNVGVFDTVPFEEVYLDWTKTQEDYVTVVVKVNKADIDKFVERIDNIDAIVLSMGVDE